MIHKRNLAFLMLGCSYIYSDGTMWWISVWKLWCEQTGSMVSLCCLWFFLVDQCGQVERYDSNPSRSPSRSRSRSRSVGRNRRYGFTSFSWLHIKQFSDVWDTNSSTTNFWNVLSQDQYQNLGLHLLSNCPGIFYSVVVPALGYFAFVFHSATSYLFFFFFVYLSLQDLDQGRVWDLRPR